jgi:GT2 family glycosyltransferase
MVKNNSNPLVSIIILNYNAGNLLLNCVDSVFKSTYPNFEVIVVDNLSTDNSHIRCKKKFEKIQLIENKDNLGYCEGNNVGIRKVKGDFLVILNPDTVVEPNWLNHLMSAYKKHGDGLYQSKILVTTEHDTLFSTGNIIQLFGFGFSRAKGEKDNKQFENDEEVGYASGTCLFTSSKIMKKIGGFDSFLFAFHDDLDLCWRGKLLGLKSYYVHKAIIYHPFEGYSFKWSSFKFFLMERNRLYCLMTHYRRSTYIKMLPSLILVEFAVTGFYINKKMLWAKIKANFDIIKNLRKINACYNNIQRNRTVSDKELIKKFSDEIEIPPWVVEKHSNSLFNKVLANLSKMSRSII